MMSVVLSGDHDSEVSGAKPGGIDIAVGLENTVNVTVVGASDHHLAVLPSHDQVLRSQKPLTVPQCRWAGNNAIQRAGMRGSPGSICTPRALSAIETMR